MTLPPLSHAVGICKCVRNPPFPGATALLRGVRTCRGPGRLLNPAVRCDGNRRAASVNMG
jgi:hypothetical protein